MEVKEVMNAVVECIEARASLREAMDKMASNHVSALLVRDGDRGIGIVTDEIIAYRVDARTGDIPGATVGDVMVAGGIGVYEGAELADVQEFMAEHRTRRLPVFDARRRLVGFLSIEATDGRGQVN